MILLPKTNYFDSPLNITRSPSGIKIYPLLVPSSFYVHVLLGDVFRPTHLHQTSQPSHLDFNVGFRSISNVNLLTARACTSDCTYIEEAV